MFGAQAGYAWQLEYSPILGAQADWRPAGNSVTGSDFFVERIQRKLALRPVPVSSLAA